MGKLAKITAGGTRLEPREAVKVKKLMDEGAVSEDSVVYEVGNEKLQKLEKGDTVQPGKTYGVIPKTDLAGA